MKSFWDGFEKTAGPKLDQSKTDPANLKWHEKSRVPLGMIGGMGAGMYGGERLVSKALASQGKGLTPLGAAGVHLIGGALGGALGTGAAIKSMGTEKHLARSRRGQGKKGPVPQNRLSEIEKKISENEKRAFWDGFEKKAGWLDKLKDIAEKGVTVSHEVNLSDKGVKQLRTAAGLTAAGLAGFAVGGVLGRGAKSRNPVPPALPTGMPDRTEGGNTYY